MSSLLTISAKKQLVRENDFLRAKLHSERVHELNGAMGFGELLFEFVFDLQVCAKRQGNGTNTIEAGMRAHQFSGGGLESGQGLLHIPTFADQAIDSVTVSLCWVHGDASFFAYRTLAGGAGGRMEASAL
jgi:hypothetical protein